MRMYHATNSVCVPDIIFKLEKDYKNAWRKHYSSKYVKAFSRLKLSMRYIYFVTKGNNYSAYHVLNAADAACIEANATTITTVEKFLNPLKTVLLSNIFVGLSRRTTVIPEYLPPPQCTMKLMEKLRGGQVFGFGALFIR